MRLLGTLLLGLGALGLVGCGDGSVQSPDFTSELVSISVTPATAELDEGETQAFTAVGNWSNPPGSDTPTSERPIEGVTWTSSNNSIVTIDATGLATGVGNGDVTITAKKGSKTATATVNAFAATLQSLEVTPTTATKPAGLSQQYTATGTYDNREGGTESRDVTGQVAWSIPVGGQFAVIDPATGVATGTSAGTATIQAALDGQTDTAEFVVTPPVITDLVIQPADPSAPLGSVVTFRSFALFTNGATQPIQATWTSSDPTVGAVTPDAAVRQDVQTLALGTTDISASATNPDGGGTIDDTSTLTVTDAALLSFARVEPQLGRVTIGRQIEYVAIGTYSDGEHQIPDEFVTWSIADVGTPPATPVATIDAATGVATGANLGVATVTATLDPGTVPSGPESLTARLTVTDAVCTTELLTADGATTSTEISPTCLGCSVAFPERVINLVPDDFATISVPIGLIGANAALQVNAIDNPNYEVPFAAGNNAGFLVAKPAGTLILAELFSQLQVSTYLEGVKQEQTGNANPLRVELLGQEVINTDLFDVALISIATSNDYDAIRLNFDSGTASALTSVLVGKACGTLDLPAPAAELVGVEKIEPQTPTILVGASLGMVAIGRYQAEDDSTILAPIPDADLVWTNQNGTDDAEAGQVTVDSLGLVTGVAAGQALITATLRDGVVTTGPTRAANTEVTILPSACETQFSEEAGATAVGSTGGDLLPLCLLCSVTEPTNAIDDSITTAARLGVNLGALLGSVSLTVTQAPTDDPQPAGQPTGFLIGRPTGTVVLAEILSAISVSALREGVVVANSAEPTVPLRLDLFGMEAVAMDDFGLVTITPTVAYDAIRLTFNVGLLSAGLQNEVNTVKAFQACAKANVPVTAKRKSIIPYKLK